MFSPSFRAETTATTTAAAAADPLPLQTPGSAAAVPFDGKILEALRAAAKEIDQNLDRDDNFPELWDLFTSGATADYTLSVRPQFYRKKIVVLPEVLLEQYSRLECKCFMGIFPQINRAWITIDNQLFLWNYDDGSDFCVYDGLDQIIVSVGLVTPKANVFVDEIKYLLVLATPVEIVILAVCFDGNTIFGELSLHPTQLALASDNVNMLEIVGTKDGRIFMAGKDGCLYELYYQAEDGWFSKRCRKINHSASILGSLMPSFLKFAQEDSLTNIVVDEARHILYTLSKKGSIQVFDLGEKGDSMNVVTQVGDVVKLAYSLCPQLKKEKEIKVQSIHVIPPSESKRVHLVAITSTGVRFYFTTNSMDSGVSSSVLLRPTLLGMIHVRMPPDYSRFMTHAMPPISSPAAARSGYFPGTAQERERERVRTYSVDTTFYSHGVLLMADSRSEQSDTLLAISPDINETLMRQRGNYYGDSMIISSRPGFFETATVLEIQGKVWSIAQVPISLSLMRGASSSSSMIGADGEIYSAEDSTHLENLSNELAVQHFVPPRQYLCLTNTGLHFLVKMRPVDHLLQLLLNSGGADTDALTQFFEQYGSTEACAMCLILATSSNTRSSPRSAMEGSLTPDGRGYFSPSVTAPDPNVALWATRAFFKHGGHPRYDPGGGAYSQPTQQTTPRAQARGQATPSAADASTGGAMYMGQAIMRRPEIIFSGSHNGFCLYLSRILRPVWNRPITIVEGLNQSQFLDLEQSLLALLQFLEQNPHFAPIPAELRAAASSDSSLQQRELESPQAGRAAARIRVDGDEEGEERHYLRSPAASARMQDRLQQLYHRKSGDEAKRAEQRSLAHAHLLLRRCKETFSFLSILGDHRFARVVRRIPEELQVQLTRITFSELVTTPAGFELTRLLVNALLSLYTGSAVNTSAKSADASTSSGGSSASSSAASSSVSSIGKRATLERRRGAELNDDEYIHESVDAICQLLRQRCPSIFGEEDRIRFKAEELLYKAKTGRTAREREDYLVPSLRMFLQIAAHMTPAELQAISEEFQFLHYYHGVVSLCLLCAEGADPAHLALSWYKEQQQLQRDDSLQPSLSTSETGEAAARATFEARQQCYQPIISVLDELLAGIPPSFSHKLPQEVLHARPTIDPTLLEREKAQTLQVALADEHSRNDQLWHITLYDWFTEHNLTHQLLESCIRFDSPFIEDYLQHTSLELLSKYYIHKRRFDAAALCNARLAERKGGAEEGLTLEVRVENYLARAVSCAKSCVGRGEMLHELQQKMDVAQIQLKIKQELGRRLPHFVQFSENELEDAKRSLDYELLSISELYNKYAKKYGLWESCLAILKCSGHNDPALVKKFWENIVLEELYNADSPDYTVDSLRTRIVSVGRSLQYPNELVLPIPWLCNYLELKSFEYQRWHYGWVVQTMREIGVPFPQLFQIYNKFFHSSDSYWSSSATTTILPESSSSSSSSSLRPQQQPFSPQLHILKVLFCLVEEWMAYRFSKRATSLDVAQFRAAKAELHLEEYVMALGALPTTSASFAADVEKCKEGFRELLAILREKESEEY
ncbi:Nucleoporin 155 [Balamuthia mandrillaris]